MPQTALIIGLPPLCRRLERQLDLLPDRPVSIGWVVPRRETADHSDPPGPVLGTLDELEALIARRRPTLALVILPAVMKELITSVRTRLRRLGIPDRYMPPLEDQLAGVGPRTQLDIDLAELMHRPPREIDAEQVRGVIAGQRVLITGAGGSIGSELARIVASFGPARLMLVDRAENALFEIDRRIARQHPDLPRTALLHDVVHADATLEHFRRLEPQVIFHAAAHKHVPMMEDHPGEAIDNNLYGTKSVADAADAVGAERFVMISTDKAVNPKSIMGATKRLAEMYVQHMNRRSATAFSLVRFGNVLGSSGSVLEIWSRQIADGGPVTITDPRMTRYFMTIPEAASLVIQSAAYVNTEAAGSEVFVLDMGKPARIVDLAKRFVELHGLTPLIRDENQPPADDPATIPIVFTGARPGEKIDEQLATDADAMLPTEHRDINIWLLPPPDPKAIESMLRTLSPSKRPSAGPAIAALIRTCVPEMTEAVAA